MARTKFDKQVDESADSLARGVARVLAGRDLDGVRRTDATFWRAGTRVLPKVEGKVRRRSYKPGWRRLSFRLALGGGVGESGYLATRDLDATRETLRELTELWENREAALAALEPAGIGAASVLTVGTAAYVVLTRERRELMREWVGPLHEALHQPLGLAEQTDPRRYLHIPKNFSDDAQIRIDLPTRLGFSRDVVADLITQKLALQGVTFSWHPEGRRLAGRMEGTVRCVQGRARLVRALYERLDCLVGAASDNTQESLSLIPEKTSLKASRLRSRLVEDRK